MRRGPPQPHRQLRHRLADLLKLVEQNLGHRVGVVLEGGQSEAVVADEDRPAGALGRGRAVGKREGLDPRQGKRERAAARIVHLPRALQEEGRVRCVDGQSHHRKLRRAGRGGGALFEPKVQRCARRAVGVLAVLQREVAGPPAVEGPASELPVAVHDLLARQEELLGLRRHAPGKPEPRVHGPALGEAGAGFKGEHNRPARESPLSPDKRLR
mmetsp:Transcript_39732/g.94340  ORF Transcript_39732/g.94340 Transcript_39732/m.94340 type:complete len:213 (+) Transcript_39732:1444-2082(+)